MKNILITGITGRSGRYFGELLVENNVANVTAIIRDKNKFQSLFGQPDNLSYEVGNILDKDFVTDLMIRKNIDVLFHISGIKASLKMVTAAIDSGVVKRIILVHTTGIYSKFKAASAEYLEIEEKIAALLKDTDISLTILRPTMIYGSLDDKNISKFIKMVDKIRLFPLVGGGKYELQPVNQKDLGRAYYQVLTNEEKTANKNYDLSGGTVIYLKDLLQNISDFLGKKTVFFNFPFGLAYFAANVAYCLSFTKFDYREKVQRLVEPRAYGHEEAEKDFGYSPMNFSDGLKEEVELYKKARKSQ